MIPLAVMEDDRYVAVAVTPENLHVYWPFMREQLEVIHRESARTDWLPEDAYVNLVTGQSVAFVFIEKVTSRLFGHVVCSRQVGRREAVLHIWSWKLNKPGCGKLLLELVKDIAQNTGCSRVTGAGTRPGLARLYRRYGGVVREVVYDLYIDRHDKEA
jgi:hypothetical protein